jgi:hypothetical protein
MAPGVLVRLYSSAEQSNVTGPAPDDIGQVVDNGVDGANNMAPVLPQVATHRLARTSSRPAVRRDRDSSTVIFASTMPAENSGGNQSQQNFLPP